MRGPKGFILKAPFQTDSAFQTFSLLADKQVRKSPVEWAVRNVPLGAFSHRRVAFPLSDN